MVHVCRQELRRIVLGLVDDAALGPERIAVFPLGGGAEHGHVHAQPGRLESSGGPRHAAADDQQVRVEAGVASVAAEPSAKTEGFKTKARVCDMFVCVKNTFVSSCTARAKSRNW